MAGCMVSVFAALAEFVVVKVLDVQYQYQVNRIPKVLPMVSTAPGAALINKKTFLLSFHVSGSAAQRISNMEKGQCATVASWEGGAVRSRKATQTPTTPGQVSVALAHMPRSFGHINIDNQIEVHYIIRNNLTIVSIVCHRHRCRAMAARQSRRVAKAFCLSPGRTRIRASRR